MEGWVKRKWDASYKKWVLHYAWIIPTSALDHVRIKKEMISALWGSVTFTGSNFIPIFKDLQLKSQIVMNSLISSITVILEQLSQDPNLTQILDAKNP